MEVRLCLSGVEMRKSFLTILFLIIGMNLVIAADVNMTVENCTGGTSIGSCAGMNINANVMDVNSTKGATVNFGMNDWTNFGTINSIRLFINTSGAIGIDGTIGITPQNAAGITYCTVDTNLTNTSSFTLKTIPLCTPSTGWSISKLNDLNITVKNNDTGGASLQFLDFLTIQVSYTPDGVADIDSNLVGRWKLDGGTSGNIVNGTTLGFEDSSGNGKNAAANNSDYNWTQGKFNGAIKNLVAGSGFVTIPTISIPTQVTASAWVNSSNFNQDGGIVAKNNGALNWALNFFTPENKLIWNGGNTTVLVSCTPPSTNIWHHVAATQDQNVVHVYIDGVDCNSANNVMGIGNGGTTLEIGRGNSSVYDGNMDSVRVYNRALSPTDINALYYFTELPSDINITFQVYQSGQCIDLNNVGADWNVNAYDLPDKNSPWIQDVNAGHYSIIFSKTGYDANTIIVTADVNTTVRVYLTVAGADTCTYGGSGNWLVNLADNCNLITDTNLSGNKFITYGTGSLIINAWITTIEAHLIGNIIRWMGKGFK